MKKNSFLSNKKLTISLHVLAWGVIVLLPQYLNNYVGRKDDYFLYHFYTNIFFYGVLFYLNYLLLVPKLFFKEKRLRYFLSVISVIFSFSLAMWFVNDHLLFDENREQMMQKVMEALNEGRDIIKPPMKEFRILGYFYSSILICGFSLGLGVLKKLGQNEKERKELEKEKLNSELAFLKNQVSPHFFFNTLNNIYALIGIDAEEARHSVLKLSKLMRYLLYDSEHGESKLSQEIEFLTNYIDLMKLRLSNKVKLEVSFPEKYNDYLIPPLLFVPFVENAFKHGVSYRGDSFIYMRMTANDKGITFVSRNSVNLSKPENDRQHSGIGLENVKKRLNLLFPGTHKLKIEQTPGEFAVELFLETRLIKLNTFEK